MLFIFCMQFIFAAWYFCLVHLLFEFLFCKRFSAWQWHSLSNTNSKNLSCIANINKFISFRDQISFPSYNNHCRDGNWSALPFISYLFHSTNVSRSVKWGCFNNLLGTPSESVSAFPSFGWKINFRNFLAIKCNRWFH